jgi:lysozyme
MARASKTTAWLSACILCVSGFEGLRTYVYLDPVGIPTYCFGETANPQWSRRYSIDECKGLLSTRLEQFNNGVNRCVQVGLPDTRRAAVVSLAYNIGTGALCKSSIIRKLNAGDVRGACDAFLKWNKAAGIALPGLTRRRQEERALCLQGA